MDIDVDMDEFFKPYEPTPPPTPPTSLVNKDMDTSLPRFSAKDKEKSKEIPPSIPQPPLAVFRLDVDISGVSGSAALMPEEDGDFSTLSVTYGSSDVLTSPALNLINCYLYIPLRILVCVICGIAIQPRSMHRH